MQKQLILVVAIFSLFLISCSSDDDPQGKLSPEVSAFLKMRLSGSQMEALNSPGNPAQTSFNGMMTNFGIGGRSDDAEDTTFYEVPWIWETCAVVTTVENEDGSTTETYDYGDGCLEGYEGYQYLMQGKYTQTYRSNYVQEGDVYSDDYLYSSVYENYGGTYYADYYEGGVASWSMDGYSDYVGSSVYDIVEGTFAGNYTFSAENTYRWEENEYYYKSDGSASYGNNTYTSTGSYEYRVDADDYYYSVEILEPLVMDYSCYNNDGPSFTTSMWYSTYVSGIESIHFKENGVEGAFTINYGNGKCDHIVLITENGVSVKVDLSKLYTGIVY